MAAAVLADSRRLPAADRGGPYPDPERAGLGFDPRVQAEVVQALDLVVVVDAIVDDVPNAADLARLDDVVQRLEEGYSP
jgi:hypothetical protein